MPSTSPTATPSGSRLRRICIGRIWQLEKASTGDFGSIWEYTQHWDLYARKANLFTVFGKDHPFAAYHAYSHINSLSGAGAAYFVTGESRYLETLENAYDFLLNNETFATGGIGPNERLMPPENNAATLSRSDFHFETQCGTWAIFKLGKYLASFTGDAKYADWIERVLINGIGASIPTPPNGHVHYMSNYNINGAEKRGASWGAWSCCAGTRPMAAADFHDLIYFKDPENLYVALFADSTVQWTHRGASVKLSQRTRFPEDHVTELVVMTDRPATFGLKIRVPGWLSGPMEVSLNGTRVPVKADARHSVAVTREWRDGDRVRVSLPMDFWLCPLPNSGGFPAAVMRGPVTMAFRSQGGNPSAKVAFENLERNFLPSAGEPLNFHLSGDPSVLVRPFYEFQEGERYFIYLHPDLGKWLSRWEFTSPEGDRWDRRPWYRSARKVGASFEYAFEGTGIQWRGFRFEDGGKAEITLDGKSVGIVDQYGPALLPANPPAGPVLPFEWEYRGLPPGKHTLKVRIISDKSEASKGNRITITEFKPLQD